MKKQGGSCFKIVHEKHRAKHQDDSINMSHSAIQDILRAHPELKPSIQKFVVSFLSVCLSVSATLKTSMRMIMMLMIIIEMMMMMMVMMMMIETMMIEMMMIAMMI